MTPTRAPTNATDSNGNPIVVEVFGDNLGVLRTVLFGGEEVVELPGGNHTYLSFLLTPGQGVRHVALLVGNQFTNVTTSVNSVLVHDPPSLNFMNPNSGMTSACQELEPVTVWYSRIAQYDAAADKTRLCCNMDSFRIEGKSQVMGWVVLAGWK